MSLSLLPTVRLAVVALSLIIASGCAREPTPEILSRAVQADFQEMSVQLDQYASAHNRLPASLRDLEERTDWQSVNTKCRRNYGYAVSADGLVAVLVSVGPDGQPDTPDDHVKVIDIRSSESGKEKETSTALLRTVYGAWSCAPMRTQ
jgi:hypothetical protein